MTKICEVCKEYMHESIVDECRYFYCHRCDSKIIREDKIYVDKRTYDSLLAASTYNQKLGDAMDDYEKIGLSDDFSYNKVKGARILMLNGHDVPYRISECMIKYGIKK